jgi:hypothetical protein
MFQRASENVSRVQTDMYQIQLQSQNLRKGPFFDVSDIVTFQKTKTGTNGIGDDDNAEPPELS